MTRSTKILSFISITYFIIIAALVGYGAYEVQARGEALQERRNTLAMQTAKEQAYNDLERTIQTTAAQRAQIDDLFLTQDGTVAFITSIEQAAQQLNLELEQGLAVEGEGENTRLVANFTFTGSRASVRGFAELLANLPYLSSVPSIGMRGNARSWTGTATVSITLVSDES